VLSVIGFGKVNYHPVKWAGYEKGEGTRGNPTASGWGIKNLINGIFDKGSKDQGMFCYKVRVIYAEPNPNWP